MSNADPNLFKMSKILRKGVALSDINYRVFSNLLTPNLDKSRVIISRGVLRKEVGLVGVSLLTTAMLNVVELKYLVVKIQQALTVNLFEVNCVGAAYGLVFGSDDAIFYNT